MAAFALVWIASVSRAQERVDPVAFHSLAQCEAALRARPPRARSAPVRIGSWNIRWFPRGTRHGKNPEQRTDLRWLACAIVSLEVDVKSVLTKVTTDEADAGFVYATDAVAAGDQVTSFPIPHAKDEITTYPIATLDQSKNPDVAKEFMDLVLGSQGQKVLADAGFAPAP